MPERDREREEALDRALASYIPASEGLERRVLVQVERRIRRRRLWQWTSLGAVAAVALLCAMVWPLERPQKRPAREIAQTVQLPLPPPPERQLEVVWKPVPKPERRIVREPKLAQFPAPYPLTDEERALLRLASFEAGKRSKPEPTIGAPIQPIEIAAVEIKPLEDAANEEE
ncbi:MAG TPA: hypothetical protein VKX25_18705 [Bryobacteraceae bacterium]|jgi:hypothetical protein|nr:hypothetical protein [Bryobacteraceae bacterium]